jgi:nucleoside 2-deoxyribosyltransferase
MARGVKPGKKKSYTVYFASELFSLKHLIGNAYLAEAIYEKSHGKYLCVLPQNIEQRRTTAHSIRDHDIRTLLSCDLALFNYDGTELDSGTVVEFMFAKFADIPSVLLRSDIRHGGDQVGDPWNLMTSFYPRTASVLVNSITLYKAAMQTRQRASTRRGKLDEVVRLAGQHSSADAQKMCEQIAAACVRALDKVTATEPVMPKHLREEVYQWLALMPNLNGNPKKLRRELEAVLERKVERDLL